ncbi:MAG: hypothetical protein KF880_00070 [Ferruginibacter sp.]|nr:hypothetical protein [Ferruginibacter sp.]
MTTDINIVQKYFANQERFLLSIELNGFEYDLCPPEDEYGFDNRKHNEEIVLQLKNFGKEITPTIDNLIDCINVFLNDKEKMINAMRFICTMDPLRNLFNGDKTKYRNCQEKLYINLEKELLKRKEFLEFVKSKHNLYLSSPKKSIVAKSKNTHAESDTSDIPIDVQDYFKKNREKFVSPILDVRQSALFFHYLREFELITNVNNTNLATVVTCLTTHSESNIRKAFTHIDEIKMDAYKYVNSEIKKDNVHSSVNLEAVKKALTIIVEAIDKQIVRNKNK